MFNSCHSSLDFAVEKGLKKVVSNTLIHQEMTQIVLEASASFETNYFMTFFLKFINFSALHSIIASLQRILAKKTQVRNNLIWAGFSLIT